MGIGLDFDANPALHRHCIAITEDGYSSAIIGEDVVGVTGCSINTVGCQGGRSLFGNRLKSFRFRSSLQIISSSAFVTSSTFVPKKNCCFSTFATFCMHAKSASPNFSLPSSVFIDRPACYLPADLWEGEGDGEGVQMEERGAAVCRHKSSHR